MPPKKNKDQRASQATTKSSAAPPRGRKRKNSDASVVSSQSQTVTHDVVTTTTSKRRKQKQDGDQPNLGELQELEEEDSHIERYVEVSQARPKDDGVSQHTQKIVHFDEVESDSELGITTASHITPHPRKMLNIRRRTTASPALLNGHNKHVEIKTSRMSLPPSLSQEDDVNHFDVEEMSVKYVPLHEALKQRMELRQRIRRLYQDIRIKRQEGDTDGILKLEEELSTLTSDTMGVTEMNKLSNHDAIGEDMLVLGSQEVTYPVLPKVESDESRLELVRDVSLREESFTEAERRKLQDAILSLSAEAENAKEQRRLLEQELIGLGLAADDIEDPSLIMASIRESFAEIRTKINTVLPGEIDESYSNVEVVRILMANVREFAGRLQKQDRAMQERGNIIDDLKYQINGLLDLLATSKDREEKLLVEIESVETRANTLRKRFGDLDQAAQEKERENDELQENFEKLENERDALEAELQSKAEESQKNFDMGVEHSQNVLRLGASLKEYQSETTRLEKLVIGFEQEARDSKTSIVSLEQRISLLDQEAEEVKQELARVALLYEKERESHSEAEDELREKGEEVNDLEARVDQLEVEAKTLGDELDRLRELGITERAQREEAEAELDKAIEETEELNKKLHEKGAEANQLRQKLFENQQKSQAQIITLESAATERDDQYQKDIAEEVSRREAADALAEEQASEIQALNVRVAEVEDEMRALLAERDDRISVLEIGMEEELAALASLRDELNKARGDASANADERDQIKTRLDTIVITLNGTIVEHANTIAALETDAINTASLHDSEMEDFKTHVADLNSTIVGLRTDFEKVATEKGKLEKRVEEEAEEALEIQASKDDEIDDLNQMITERNEKIKVIDDKARADDARWQDLLVAREEEIETLRSTGEIRQEEVTTLYMNLEALKTKFAEYVRRTELRFAKAREAAAANKAVIDEEAAGAEDEGARMLEEIKTLKFEGEVTVSTKTTSSNVQESVSAKKTRGKKKRVQDSGFYELGEEEMVS